MGASVSLMELPHDPELSREIKTEYEDLVESDMNLEEIEEHLSRKYSAKASRKSIKQGETLIKSRKNANPDGMYVPFLRHCLCISFKFATMNQPHFFHFLQ